ncbi:MAG: T9SS type A sorting domain-containing protein [candidate division Zixibacteria bacterium]|nr:T9SS type A sorting domain-containing protein [candidate division Zixibacteria bacterium]
MGKKLVLFVILSILVFGSAIMGQNKAPDPGIPDTVTFESMTVPDGTEQVSLEITLYNDEEISGFGLPFMWDSPDLIADSITFGGSRIDYVNTKPTAIDTINGQRLQVGMVIIMESFLQPGNGNLFTIHFSIDPGAAAQVITFDSTSYSAGSPFILTLTNGQTMVPQYKIGTLTIGTPVSDPTIGLSETELNFSGVEGESNPASQMFSVANTGDGTLNWTASDDAAWVSLDATSGVDAGDVNVSVNIAGLGAGDHTATITVSDPTATNNPQTITVNLHLEPSPPCLALSTIELNFAGIEGEMQSTPLTITNCGGQPLDWNITGIDEAWLSVDLSSGSTAGSQQVSFMVNFTGLAPGGYSDVVTISGASGTENSPQDVTINVQVIDTTPDADTVWVANISATAGNQVVVDINYQNFVAISGIVDLPLTFTGDDIICDSVSYVGTRVEHFSQKFGIIDNAAQTIVVAAFPIVVADLEAGNGLLAKLYFSVAPEAATQSALIDTAFIAPGHSYAFLDENGANRATEFFTGGINITGLPCFDFPVPTVAFTGEVGTTIASQSFSATNNCYGTLNVGMVSDNAAWLSVSSTDPYAFSVNTTGLAEGDYDAIVTFTSNAINSPFEVPVTLSLFAVPELAVSPTSFDFGTVCRGTLLSGSFDISNIGTGTLDWTADAIEDIPLSAYSGSAPTTVTFDVITDELEFGPQTWDIIVASAGTAGSPKVVSLTMNLANCDECTFDIAEVDGMQGFPVAVPIYAFQVSNIAAIEFHLDYDPDLQRDSITSEYMTGYLANIANPIEHQIHFVWDNLFNPATVPDGEPILTLWFTSIGAIGTEAPITWLEGNEIVDPFGEPLLGIGYCNGAVTIVDPVFDISGKVTYYNQPTITVEGVSIALAGLDNEMALTGIDGTYLFENVHLGAYTITPTKDDNDPGASVADIVSIRRHLAYVERLESPYQMIAGDVNLSTTVTVADVIVMRRYLAELDPLPSGNWAFVVWDYAITMENWHIASDQISLTLIDDDIAMQDFIAIRMGDVDGSWPSGVFSKQAFVSGNKVDITFGEFEIKNNTLNIPITISDIEDMAGLELHFNYNATNVSFIGIKSDILTNVTSNGTSDEIHIVWEDINVPIEISGSETVAVIAFALEGAEVSGEITIEGAELVNVSGQSYAIDYSDKGSFDGIGAIPSAYSLEQNSPNPFNPATTIKATMSEAGEYSLVVYNVMGQRIKTFEGYNEAGTIEFVWDGTDDNGLAVSSGIYLYKFSVNQFSDTKKMMLLK